MKYSQWIGIAAALALVVAGFLPWTWHPDLQKEFTGYYSENNVYGKPGKVFLVLSIVAVFFFMMPKIWAKRWNLLIGALIAAYAIKSFMLFSGCYAGTCPEKRIGLWLMLISAIIVLLMTVFPDISLSGDKKQETKV